MCRRGKPVDTFFPYQNSAVRDLAWACFSPALLHTGDLHSEPGYVTDAAFELTPARRLWLETLDRDAEPLLDCLSERPPTRLGLYFERLWHFFLRADPEVELVAHNLPINDGGRTLGEFDCLYYCHARKTHVHLELAVKFYLGVPGEPAERAWVGPNVRDRLDLKLQHLLEQQINLGARDAARRQLEELGIETPAREIALRGYLFQPGSEALPSPRGYNPGRPFASWWHLEKVKDCPAIGQADSFRLLSRLEWLGPRCTPPRDRVARDNLLTHLHERLDDRPSPVLIAALDSSGEEFSRFFLVPDGWPDSGRPTR